MLKEQFVVFKRNVYEIKVNEYVRRLVGQRDANGGSDPEMQQIV